VWCLILEEYLPQEASIVLHPPGRIIRFAYVLGGENLVAPVFKFPEMVQNFRLKTGSDPSGRFIQEAVAGRTTYPPD